MTGAIPDVDAGAQAAARARQAVLTKPTGALGRLEDVSVWVCGVQGRCPPVPFRQVRVVLFAADHGVASAGVSAYPSEVTAQMVANFLAGGAAVNVMAREIGATVRVVDVGVATDVAGADRQPKLRRGSGRIDLEDALSIAEAQGALDAGRDIADGEIDAGADLIVPGDMGIGSTTICAALTSALLGVAPESVVGRGTGVDDAGYQHKIEVVSAAVARVSAASAAAQRDPVTLLSQLGGSDVAAMTGLLLRAAARRTPVLLDGVVSAVAALVAARLEPSAVQWWLAGHRSTEPAQRAALDALALAPVLDLELRLGEGTGALAALPLVQLAIATLADMATFDSAGVSDKVT